MHDPIPIGTTGSHRFPGYYPFAATQSAPWIAVAQAPNPVVVLYPATKQGVRRVERGAVVINSGMAGIRQITRLG